jgi:hypothetical protein
MNEDKWEVQSASSDERSERRLWLNAFTQFADRHDAKTAADEADLALSRYRNQWRAKP